MSAEYLTPRSLAELLGLHPQTVRTAIDAAAERMRKGEPLSDREKAFLSADQTPGGHLRWSHANAARVLRAFGKPVPAEWAASPAGPEAAR